MRHGVSASSVTPSRVGAASVARRGVFLDRDGTLHPDVDFLREPGQLSLYPGAGAAVARLNDLGIPVILVTNQSGIARGMLDEARLEAIHAELERQLAEHGARLDAIYYCPHHPTEGSPPYRTACSCRKPNPGMLIQASQEHQLDLGGSWIVGDSARDLQAGAAVGARGVLVATGKGASTAGGLRERGSEFVYAPDLAAAVDTILEAQGR